MIELWPIIETLLKVIAAPVIGLMIWAIQRHAERVNRLNDRVTQLEKETAVIFTKLDSMDKKIDDIKRCVEKLADKK